MEQLPAGVAMRDRTFHSHALGRDVTYRVIAPAAAIAGGRVRVVYILHGMGNEHYYRSQDCHRLFVFLDLYMEMLVLETGVGEHPMIPDDPGIEKRRQHYEDLMMSSERTRPTSARFALLREHPHFHDEPIRESFFERLARWARVMGAD